MKEPAILTNHPGCDRSQTWQRKTFSPEFDKFSTIAFLDNFHKAVQLFRLRKHFEVVVLGGGAQYDMFYLILQRLWPRHVRPVVKIDCLWYRSAPLLQFCKKALFRWLDRSVDRYVVWCRHEINGYSKVFGLPKDKFIFIPYHTTNVETFESKDGGYAFSGGNYARDYRTLVKAVRGLDLRVIIACTNRQAVDHIELPDNVSVVRVEHREFIQLMAEARINIVSLDSCLLHSGGQQTFLNAMALGKPVIVTDPVGGQDYIEHGVDGILVPGGDPHVLRTAILGLLENPEAAALVGARAREKAQKLDTENTLSAISEVAIETLSQSGNSLEPAI